MIDKELIERLAREADIYMYVACLSDEEAKEVLTRFAALIAEACAKAAEATDTYYGNATDDACSRSVKLAAAVIRERFKP